MLLMPQEQTECPYCGNKDGNLVLQNEEDHWHRCCRKCFKHYIVYVLKDTANYNLDDLKAKSDI